MDTILTRISQIAENEGITITALEKRIGASKGVLSRALAKGSDIQSKWVQSIVDNYHQYSAEWLLTGRGEMTKANASPCSLNESNTVRETRPRIRLDAAAGALSIAENGIYLEECEQLPLIESLPKYDFTIFAKGDSMSPEYESGDELACLFIRESQFIQSGRVHVLDTAQGIVVKIVYDEGEYFLCSSINQRYRDFRIHKSEVFNIALVVGLLRKY